MTEKALYGGPVPPDPIPATGHPDSGDTAAQVPASDAEFDWSAFLARWSTEWADAADPAAVRERGLGDARERRWLGFAPAEPAAIAALEARAGRPLPPSFLAFLKVSDGWREVDDFVWLMGRADLTQIHGDPDGLGAIWSEDADPEDEEALHEAGIWARSLQLAHESDVVDVLLDPLDVTEDGEWAVRVWAAWSGSEPEHHPSFRAYMEAAYEEFLRSTASRNPRLTQASHAGHASTDTLDAQVERARCLALAGDPDGALTLLDPAVRAGRPRAAAIQQQLDALLSPRPVKALPLGPGNTTWETRELLPCSCAFLAQVASFGEGPDQEQLLSAFPQAGAELIESVSRAVFDGTYRHPVEGPFGEAVATARELARWGALNDAWAVLREGMRAWRPYDDHEHVAPLGLAVDGLLGPLLTPRRARELLSVPRGDAASEHGADWADWADDAGTSPDASGQDGLSWLVEDSRAFDNWWLVLARGAEPTDLPRILGTQGGLSTHPVTADQRRETAYPRPAPRTTKETTKEQPGHASAVPVFWNGNASAAAVGRAGTGPEARGWAFALVEHSARGPRQSPATSASAISGGQVLSLAGTWNLDPDAPVLHVTAAEAGRVVWEVAVGPARSFEPTVRGDVPPALDPRRLPIGPALDPSGPARWLCGTLAAEFGVSLSREAVDSGRLHSLEVPPWILPAWTS